MITHSRTQTAYLLTLILVLVPLSGISTLARSPKVTPGIPQPNINLDTIPPQKTVIKTSKRETTEQRAIDKLQREKRDREREFIRNKLISALRKKLHQPKKLNIRILNTPYEKLKVGHFTDLVVETENALIDGLNIKKATLSFHDVKLVLHKLIKNEVFEIPHLDTVKLDAIITEDDLNAMVRKKVKEVKNPHITIKKNRLILSGKARLGGLISLNFRTAGSFKVKNNSEIHFVARNLKIGGLPVPFARTAINRINPVIDMDKFPFSINLSGISLEDKQMHFYSNDENTENNSELSRDKNGSQTSNDRFNRDRGSYLSNYRRRRR